MQIEHRNPFWCKNKPTPLLYLFKLSTSLNSVTNAIYINYKSINNDNKKEYCELELIMSIVNKNYE